MVMLLNFTKCSLVMLQSFAEHHVIIQRILLHTIKSSKDREKIKSLLENYLCNRRPLSLLEAYYNLQNSLSRRKKIQDLLAN